MELNPEELWRWFRDFHWQHWHGVWLNWQASRSPQLARKYRSIRSFESRAEDGSIVFHKNDWYDPSGSSDRKMTPKSWLIDRRKHCAADGIIHPAAPGSRTLVFPNGDLVWLPVEIDFPQRPVIGEIFFMLPAKNARVAIVVTNNTDGSLAASQILEETRDSDDRPDDSWGGHVWDHDRASIPLEPVRQEPAGRFLGEETTIYRSSNLTLETKKDAIWGGFQTQDDSTLIHLPYGFTACAPNEVKIGKNLCYAVNWVVSDSEVRKICWNFSEGKLEYVTTATYVLQI